MPMTPRAPARPRVSSGDPPVPSPNPRPSPPTAPAHPTPGGTMPMNRTGP